MNNIKIESMLISKLAEKGIRLTRQRRILVDVIQHATEHLHASDLLRLAREQDHSIDRSTVYRTLSMLKQHGLIEELDLLHLDGAEHHYEIRQDAGHVHIGCTQCGRITEFQTDLVASLEGAIREQANCDVHSIRIEVSALCPECRRQR